MGAEVDGLVDVSPEVTAPTPYYEDEWTTIYHGDCREIMPVVSADAVITDPPYGTGYYATDTDVLSGTLFASWHASHKTLAVFGWPERLVALCVAARVVPDEWVTWWPTNAPLRARPVPCLMREAEAVAVFGDIRGFANLTQPKSEASRRLTITGQAWADEHGAKESDRGASDGSLDTRHLGDVWTYPAPGIGFHTHLRQHPNEKPIAVLHRLIEGLTAASDIIVDPFMGSGTALRAAKDLGRRSIGIEIEERYCESAVRRLAQGVMFGVSA